MPELPKVEQASQEASTGVAGAAPPSQRDRHTRLAWSWLPLAAIVAAALLAYLPSLSNGTIWDDDQYVTENKTLRSWSGLAATWTQSTANPQYYPLVFTTFWIEYHLWGLHPLGYHLVNVLLHAASAVVLALLLRRLGVAGALLAGLVFAVHPVHVESVAWITERKNVLSGLLYLLAATAYLRFDPPQGGRRRWRLYLLAAVLFAGALLSKTVTCTLPAALGLVLWWKRPRLSLRDLWPLAPLLVVGAVMGLTTAWLEKIHVRAEGTDWAFSIPQRLLIAGQALWFYASKLLWPHPLVFIYPRWNLEQVAWWQYLFPASAAGMMVGLVLRRRSMGKGPAAAVFFFAGTLMPALGFINIYPMRFSFVADHFQYLASISLIALGCAAVWRLGERQERVGRRVVIVLTAAAVVALAAATWRQTKIYRNAERLWQATLTKNPDCWIAHANLGNLYYLAGLQASADGDDAAARALLEKALFHLAHAARLRSDFPEALHNLALAYARLGRHDEAIALFQQALKLPPQFHILHTDAIIHTALASSLVQTGHVEEGIAHYRAATQLAPRIPDAYNDLSVVLMQRGQLDEAEELFRQAIAIHPETFEPHENLGILLETEGKLAEAAESYQAALVLKPTSGSTHRRLAFVLARLGRAQPAITEFNASVRLIGPDNQAAMELMQILKETTGLQTQAPAK